MIICGDVRTIMPMIPNNYIDLIITDPPYLIDFQSNQRVATPKFQKIKNDTLGDIDLIDFYFMECNRVLKDNTAIYSFCGWQTIEYFKPLFEKYFSLKNILVWDKLRHGMGDLKGSFAYQYELILYGHKGRSLVKGYRNSDVLKSFPKVPPGNLVHPNEKPVPLLEFLMSKSSNINDLVFDGFMGSGSTAIAAKSADRKFLGVEISPYYCGVSKRRLEEMPRRLF
jgi:site-specific DNA-methyltransferase (adenine-specific)